jgi:FkbM family methyltransferase
MFYNNQIKYIEDIFKKLKNGFFIDIGSYDGISLNNTYYLEKNDEWRGINIEQNETSYKKLLKNRTNSLNLNIAIDNQEGENLFLVNSGKVENMSGLKKYYDFVNYFELNKLNKKLKESTKIEKINTFKLSTILEKNKINNINYLTIDTMGSELAIIKSINFEKVFIDVISFPNKNFNIVNFLNDKNFEIINDKLDHIFMVNKNSKFNPNKLKIIVCTMAVNDWYFDIVRYSIKNMKMYCERHNYEFLIDDGNNKDTVYDGNRDCPWYKILFIKKIMKEKDFDYLFWVDADCQFLMHDRKLEYYIDKYFPKNKDILITDDRTTLNTGVIFLRKTDFNIELMDRIWKNENDFDRDFHEQTSLEEIYKRDQNVKDKIEIMKFGGPKEDLVVFWGGYFPGKIFLMHVARCSHDKFGFMYMIDQFYPFKLDEENEEEYKERMEWLNNANICRPFLDKCLRKESVNINFSARVKKYFNLK